MLAVFGALNAAKRAGPAGEARNGSFSGFSEMRSEGFTTSFFHGPI
jgi:hypothetical protein